MALLEDFCEVPFTLQHLGNNKNYLPLSPRERPPLKPLHSQNPYFPITHEAMFLKYVFQKLSDGLQDIALTVDAVYTLQSDQAVMY